MSENKQKIVEKVRCLFRQKSFNWLRQIVEKKNMKKSQTYQLRCRILVKTKGTCKTYRVRSGATQLLKKPQFSPFA